MAIIGSLISVIKQFEVICLGRFIHATAAGVLVCAASKLIEGQVPAHLMDYGFSCSTNILITTGILISMLLNIELPDESEWNDTNYWMAFYLSPIPILMVATVLNYTVYQFESIEYYV